MRIFVATWASKEVTLEVETEDTIASIKRKLHDKEGIRARSQRLCFGHVSLDDDDRTIGDYGITKDARLTLILPRASINPWLPIPADPMSGCARRRKKCEIARIEEQQGSKWKLLSSGDGAGATQIRLLIHGPLASPYEGADFKLLVGFPREYPFKEFEMRMCTPIYHPLIFFPWDVPPSSSIPHRIPQAPSDTAESGRGRSEFFASYLEPGSIALFSPEGSSYKEKWSTKRTVADGLDHLYAMLQEPGRADIYRHPALRRSYSEYEEWKTKKEMHWDRARAAVQFHIIGKWSIQTHRLCLPAFKHDVKILYLINQRTSRHTSETGLPTELLIEITKLLWVLHHSAPGLREV